MQRKYKLRFKYWSGLDFFEKKNAFELYVYVSLTQARRFQDIYSFVNSKYWQKKPDILITFIYKYVNSKDIYRSFNFWKNLCLKILHINLGINLYNLGKIVVNCVRMASISKVI